MCSQRPTSRGGAAPTLRCGKRHLAVQTAVGIGYRHADPEQGRPTS